MGGFLPKKKAPPSDSTLGGFVSPESTYRASMGAPPRSIEQRPHGSEPPTEGRGKDKARSKRAPSPWLWSFFCFFSLPRSKKRRGHPRGQKAAPQRYLPLGGCLLAGSEYIALEVVVIAHKQIPRKCFIVYITTCKTWNIM